MSENYGSDNILPEARKQRKQMKEQLSALAKSPAPEADSTSETPRRTAMSDDPTQDAHSLGIALRLAQAQNRELRKQLAASTSNGSLKFQDGICHDCESPDLCIQDNGCHNTGKVFSRIEHPSQQWQPIETHPKNGKEFLCIDMAGNIDIQWHPMVPAPEEYTHWMPLPPAPTPKSHE